MGKANNNKNNSKKKEQPSNKVMMEVEEVYYDSSSEKEKEEKEKSLVIDPQIVAKTNIPTTISLNEKMISKQNKQKSKKQYPQVNEKERKQGDEQNKNDTMMMSPEETSEIIHMMHGNFNEIFPKFFGVLQEIIDDKGQQQQQQYKITIENIKEFIAFLILTTQTKMKAINDYFSHPLLNIISRDLFLSILSTLTAANRNGWLSDLMMMLISNQLSLSSHLIDQTSSSQSSNTTNYLKLFFSDTDFPKSLVKGYTPIASQQKKQQLQLNECTQNNHNHNTNHIVQANVYSPLLRGQSDNLLIKDDDDDDNGRCEIKKGVSVKQQLDDDDDDAICKRSNHQLQPLLEQQFLLAGSTSAPSFELKKQKQDSSSNNNNYQDSFLSKENDFCSTTVMPQSVSSSSSSLIQQEESRSQLNVGTNRCCSNFKQPQPKQHTKTTTQKAFLSQYFFIDSNSQNPPPPIPTNLEKILFKGGPKKKLDSTIESFLLSLYAKYQPLKDIDLVNQFRNQEEEEECLRIFSRAIHLLCIHVFEKSIATLLCKLKNNRQQILESLFKDLLNEFMKFLIVVDGNGSGQQKQQQSIQVIITIVRHTLEKQIHCNFCIVCKKKLKKKKSKYKCITCAQYYKQAVNLCVGGCDGKFHANPYEYLKKPSKVKAKTSKKLISSSSSSSSLQSQPAINQQQLGQKIMDSISKAYEGSNNRGNGINQKPSKKGKQSIHPCDIIEEIVIE